jgi:CheY-like chemotaxis protein
MEIFVPTSTTARILYLDDQQYWREQVGGLLRDYGYMVEAVPTVDEAREHLRSGWEFDLLIADVRLNEQDESDVSGIALATQIRDEGSPLPVIILTAYQNSLSSAVYSKISKHPYKFSVVGKGEMPSKSENGLLCQIENSLPLNKRSIFCFVVMPFDPEFDEVYSAIQETLKELNIPCFRADKDHRAGYVPEKVREHLRRSTFVIADLTGHIPNVMYELGYAHASRRDTILLCQDYDSDLPRELGSFHAVRYGSMFSGIQELKNDLRTAVLETLSGQTVMPALRTGITCLPKTCAILASDKSIGQTAHSEIILPVVQKLGLQPLPQESLRANLLLVEQQWMAIQRASVIIAEISDGDPSVYYQVGVADALRHDCVVFLVCKDAKPPFNLRGRANLIEYNPTTARTAKSAHSEIEKRLQACLNTRHDQPASQPPQVDDQERNSRIQELFVLINRFSRQADSEIQERIRKQWSSDRILQSDEVFRETRQFVGERVEQYITAVQAAQSLDEANKVAHDLLTHGPRWADEALNRASSLQSSQPVNGANPIPGLVVREATSVDLELLVSLSGDGQTLAYVLHNPNGGLYHHKPVGSVRLASSPQALMQKTFDHLSALAKKPSAGQPPVETQQATQAISDIGSNLYDELFPLEFKLEYRVLRKNYRGMNLLITSDEPWIPWEMVRPVQNDAEGIPIYDDPPLCDTFQLARWTAGRAAPRRLYMQRAVLIRPSHNLKAASVEAAFFADLEADLPGLQVGEPLRLLSDVLDAFRGGSIHLFHFACHGNFDVSDPNESKLKLSDGVLTASQLTGNSQSGLRRAKPFVFLNACHSGQRGYGLTRIGGWAQRFINCGASAFVGTLWEINDVSAATFTVEFYRRLFGLEGYPQMMLGQAFREARLVIKNVYPGDPTWLAFVLYGNPLAYVRIGGSGA